MSKSEGSSETANRLLLVSLLQPQRVPEEELLRRYPAFVGNLKSLCQVVPTAPCYLEVWPPGFESHNVAFGALFHRSLHAANKRTKILLTTTAQATAVNDGCAYMQAVSVVANAKLGVPESTIVAIATKSHDTLTLQENLVVETVQALCGKPTPTLTKDQKNNLVQTFGAKHAEWFVGGVAAFGFLTKFMDAIVVELEQPTADIANGLLGKYGWTPGAHGWMLDPASESQPLPKADSFSTRMKNLRFLPGTISYVNGLQKGVPAKWSKLQPFLKARTGHDFPFMANIQTPYMRKGLGAMVILNLDPLTSVSGLAVKCLIGMMFATFVRSDALETAVRDMSNKFGVSDADLEKVRTYALDDEIACYKFSNTQVRALLVLGKAILPTPAKVTPQVVDHLRDVDVGASVIVEVVLWVSLLTTLHRMSFYNLL